jgi:hypothetical protein
MIEIIILTRCLLFVSMTFCHGHLQYPCHAFMSAYHVFLSFFPLMSYEKMGTIIALSISYLVGDAKE